jgi:hypothetical protein
MKSQRNNARNGSKQDELSYENCLNESIEESGAVLFGLKKIYDEYPKPSSKIWHNCVKEARMLFGSPVAPTDCMGRYELVLAMKGFDTMSELMANLAIESNIRNQCGASIPAAFLVASAIRDMQDSEQPLEHPLHLLSKREKALLRKRFLHQSG